MNLSIKDAIAPQRITIMDDYAVVSNEYVRTIVVSGYPSHIASGWLSEFVTYQDRVDVSTHIKAMDREYAITILNSEVAKL